MPHAGMHHELMLPAMLPVRGQHVGIGHNRLESTASDDMQLAVEEFGDLPEQPAA